jgi:hypothetical protein
MIDARQRCESSNNIIILFFIDPAEKLFNLRDQETLAIKHLSPLKKYYKIYNEFATLLVFYNWL